MMTDDERHDMNTLALRIGEVAGILSRRGALAQLVEMLSDDEARRFTLPVVQHLHAMLGTALADDAITTPAFDHDAVCSPQLTQCPRCKNPHHACDQWPGIAARESK